MQEQYNHKDHFRAEGDMLSPSASEILLRDSLIKLLRDSGIEVIDDVEEGQRVLAAGNASIIKQMTAKQKRALETVSFSQDESYHQTVISSADGAKILNNLDTLVKEYENSIHTKEKTFIGALAEKLEAHKHGSNSEYASFETMNGRVITIRLANHNAKVSTFDNHGENEGISIVVTPKDNNKLTNDGTAHVTEFYYNALKLRRADGQPLADIVRSIKQALYSGVFKDTTGLVERQEVNVDNVVRYQKAYHGSANDFDAFDTMSHLSEGEGNQAFGAGTYVADQKDLGVQYANIAYDNNHIKQTEHWNAKRLISRFPTFEDFLNNPKTKEAMAKNGKTEAELRSYYENSVRLAMPPHVLYTVEITDDNGKNYLDWDGKPSAELQRAAYDKIISLGNSQYIEGTKEQTADECRARLRKTIATWDNGLLYDRMTAWLNSQVAVSKWLNSLGYTGIKVHAAHNSNDVRYKDNWNYVIFNDKDLKIKDKIRFFRTSNGDAYGFTSGGKIYIDPRIATAETPIHEYAHLWGEALRKGNPEEWKNVVGLMKQETVIWDDVKKNYPHLESDDDIADEVLATYSGRQGAKKLRALRDGIVDSEDTVDNKRAALSSLERFKQLLSRLWKDIADLLHIHFTTAEEVADKVMIDLLNGINPVVKEKTAIQYQFIGEVGAALFDKSQEQTIRLDNLRIARQMEASNRDALTIKVATGWERGGDGLWRYEIDDSSYLAPSFTKDGMIYKLSDVLSGKGARELFSAYPEMRNFDVVYKQLDNNLSGWYHNGRIYINNSLSQEESIVTILHEIQHAIQYKEGFSTGANEKDIRERLTDIIDKEKECAEDTRGMIRNWAYYRLNRTRLNTYERLIQLSDANSLSRAIDCYWEAMDAIDNDERSILVNEYSDIDSLDDIAKSGYHVQEAKIELDRLAKLTYDSIPEVNMNSLRLVDKLTNTLKEYSDKELYSLVGGEVEARNVERRMNMPSEERRRALALETEDVARKDQLFLRDENFVSVNSEHFSADINDINKSFNEKLEKYEKGQVPFGTRFELGMPSKELESAGFPYLPITMRASLLSKKAGMDRHPFVASDLRDLVKAMQKPIAIFTYSKKNMRNLIVDVMHDDKHFLVGVTLDYQAGGIEVNSVSGLFPKESHEWIKWIQDGKAIRIDQKKKVLDLIDSLRTNPAESERIGLNLSRTANLVKDFENPVIKEENLSTDSKIRFQFIGERGAENMNKSQPIAMAPLQPRLTPLYHAMEYSFTHDGVWMLPTKRQHPVSSSPFVDLMLVLKSNHDAFILSPQKTTGEKLQLEQSLPNSKKIYFDALSLVRQVGDAEGFRVERYFKPMESEYDSKSDKVRYTMIPTKDLSNMPSTLGALRANELYRSVASAIGGHERLERQDRLPLLTDDASKHELLVRDIAAGVLMSRQGLPAVFSKEVQDNIAYYEREIKENPSFEASLMKDVDSTIKALDMSIKGEHIDYATLRRPRPNHIDQRSYSIVQGLAKFSNSESREVIVIKDKPAGKADVILPQGASLKVWNEAPGLHKDDLTKALEKDGITKVSYYNSGGSLRLMQPNDYFRGKEVLLANYSKQSLNTKKPFDLSTAIRRTHDKVIEKFRCIKDDDGKYVFFLKPEGEKSFSVYPSKEQRDRFFKAAKEEKSDREKIRYDICQETYRYAKEHPEAKREVIMPLLTEDIDLSKIRDVSLKREESSHRVFIEAKINGEVKRQPVTPQQWERLWLADDMQAYKNNLAANIFAPYIKEEVSKDEMENSNGPELSNGSERESTDESEEEEEVHRPALHL